MKKYFAEMIGTFILVFVGCGTAVVAGAQVGVLGIAVAFGMALSVIAYAIGPVSGAHVNPAVSLAMLVAKKLSFKDFIFYTVFQLVGAVVAAYALYFMVSGKVIGYDLASSGLGQNGWGIHYLGGYDMISAIIYELVATFLFIRVILEVTKTSNNYAGMVIGVTLMLMHLVGIQITGTSLNPARSFGPALLVGGEALQQLWLFVVVPLVGGLLAGLGYRLCSCCGCCKDGACEVKQEKKSKK